MKGVGETIILFQNNLDKVD